ALAGAVEVSFRIIAIKGLQIAVAIVLKGNTLADSRVDFQHSSQRILSDLGTVFEGFKPQRVRCLGYLRNVSLPVLLNKRRHCCRPDSLARRVVGIRVALSFFCRLLALTVE